MENETKMKISGVGPVYVLSICALTLLSILLSRLSFCRFGVIFKIKIIVQIIGVIIALSGIYIWIQAVVISKITKNIKENVLVTSGIYAWVRNPIYSAFTFIFSGIILVNANYIFFICPFLFWVIFTLMVKKEEVILQKIFGVQYMEYKAKVNRCIPWFPKQK